MCSWGLSSPWEWGRRVGNSWRTDADIAANWSAILRALDNGAAGLARFAGPGGWNDPDMLEVGVNSWLACVWGGGGRQRQHLVCYGCAMGQE